MKRLGLLLLLLLFSACLGARSTQRNYYVLYREPLAGPTVNRPIDGLIRVRNLDVDAVYEKFQMVVRQSPYQLRYTDQHVWAVKPNQMVSDLIAQALADARAFTSVTRELIDNRPRYTISGSLSALEIYDSDELWFAHVALQMQLVRFDDGKRLWLFVFDQRKPINQGSFAHGVRALSELLTEATSQAVLELGRLEEPRTEVPLDLIPLELPPPVEAPPDEPIFVPEAGRAVEEAGEEP